MVLESYDYRIEGFQDCITIAAQDCGILESHKAGI